MWFCFFFSFQSRDRQLGPRRHNRMLVRLWRIYKEPVVCTLSTGVKSLSGPVCVITCSVGVLPDTAGDTTISTTFPGHQYRDVSAPEGAYIRARPGTSPTDKTGA